MGGSRAARYSLVEYRAVSREVIPRWEGGDGKALSDWYLHGSYDSVEGARRALSVARARGHQTKIVEAHPFRSGGERVVETTGMRPGQDAEDYDAPA